MLCGWLGANIKIKDDMFFCERSMARYPFRIRYTYRLPFLEWVRGHTEHVVCFLLTKIMNNECGLLYAYMDYSELPNQNRVQGRYFVTLSFSLFLLNMCVWYFETMTLIYLQSIHKNN